MSYNPNSGAGLASVTEVSSVANFTTGSDTDVLVTTMTVTPGAGTYLVSVSGMFSQDNNSDISYVSIYQNGVQVAHTERHIEKFAGAHAHEVFACNAVCTVADAQAIDLRARTSTGGTADVDERSMTVTKIQ